MLANLSLFLCLARLTCNLSLDAPVCVRIKSQRSISDNPINSHRTCFCRRIAALEAKQNQTQSPQKGLVKSQSQTDSRYRGLSKEDKILIERLERLKKAARPSELLIFSCWGVCCRQNINQNSRTEFLMFGLYMQTEKLSDLTLLKQFLKGGNVSINASIFVSIVD